MPLPSLPRARGRFDGGALVAKRQCRAHNVGVVTLDGNRMTLGDEIGEDNSAEEPPLDEEQLLAYGERLEHLPLDEAEWVARVLRECHRARAAEARLLAHGAQTAGEPRDLEHEVPQIVLDAAQWLRTLWEQGYLGANRFPAQPRTLFPVVGVEDVLKSALFARIRRGKHPLPFPPPTRQGVPWHELMEEEGPFAVEAEILREDQGAPVAAVIEACRHWNVVGEPVAGREYVVQHQGKGPHFRLTMESAGARLTRLPPSCTRHIAMQERAGFRSFTLAWPKADGAVESVGLSADTWERAEAEAQHWIAVNHPQMYGQVRFERVES